MDIQLHDRGGLIGLAPRTRMADLWIAENIDAMQSQWSCNVLYLDRAVASDVIEAAIEDGLRLS